MYIELKRGATGCFVPTAREELVVSDEDVRSMDFHHNEPASDKTIFDIANEGYKRKTEEGQYS